MDVPRMDNAFGEESGTSSGANAPMPGPDSVSANLTGLQRRWLIAGLLLSLAGVGAAVGVGILFGVVPNPLATRHDVHPGHDHARPETAPLVKAVHPRAVKDVGLSIENLATVEPYYQADLRARASGIVKRVLRDIGDRVEKGGLQVEIDTPEAVQEAARAEAMVLQREQELRVSEAKLKDSLAAQDVADATIRQREADVQAAIATRDLKQRRFQRFKDLAARGTVVGSVVDEEERDYLAATAAVASARANVDRARADRSEAASRVEAARADIDLKRAQIEVARKDLERARAVTDFARVRAPFDGVVIRRTVDPGSFVQNATTGASEVLISIARVDIVTVIARFPDTIAPSVEAGMPAEVLVEDLPGITIPARVTRFTPAVRDADRTVRVEVDLFNGDDAEYDRFVKAFQTAGGDRPTKGAGDQLPIRAFPAKDLRKHRLLPGMTATIKLALGSYGESYVLPKTAVYSRSGSTYMLLIENGLTKQVPVRVQFNDGKTVRVAVLSEHETPNGATHRVLEELTGNETVVVARQLEIGDGATVRMGLAEW